jgi:SAM-dependent methyltransferase
MGEMRRKRSSFWIIAERRLSRIWINENPGGTALASTWPIRLYRGYRAIVRSDRFLTRQFLAKAARKGGASADVCLDIGAGIAPFQKAVSAHFSVASYFALDFVPSDAIDAVADATALPVAENKADLVVCFEALQHIPHYQAALDESARVLRDGGHIVLSVPFMFCECDVIDFRRWTTAGIIHELEDRGFSVLYAAHRGGACYAIVNMVIWAIHHMVPGGRANWRSSRSLLAIGREALVNALTLPFTLISWLAFTIDRLLPESGFYAGTFVFARLGSA